MDGTTNETCGQRRFLERFAPHEHVVVESLFADAIRRGATRPAIILGEVNLVAQRRLRGIMTRRGGTSDIVTMSRLATALIQHPDAARDYAACVLARSSPSEVTR